MPKPRRQPEAAIQDRILLALQQAWPDGMIWVNRTGVAWTKGAEPRPIAYGLKGSSDLICVIQGRFVGVEVKTETGRLRKEQKAFATAIARAGGVVIVARSEQEAVDGVRAALQ